jgi:hypothetical protein
MTITIDGVAKTVEGQTTGAVLYTLAGHPAALKSNGKPVANDGTVVAVTDHQVFTTK